MKGLVYALTFAIGFAVGPNLYPGPSASADNLENQLVAQADATVGEPETSPEEPVQQAEVARIVIDAAAKGRVGELIRFDLTESVADNVKWLLNPESQDFETYENGFRAVFSARTPGEYVFIIAAAKDGTVDVVRHVVRIEGPPEQPESQSLTDWIPYWLYPMQLPAGEAETLAQSFEDVAARITAISTPKGIIEATAEANRAALGDSLETWKPLLKKIQAALAKRAQAGTLTTPEQHKETWLEIARGLRRYAS